jgi:hypothetical protein
MFDQLIPLLDAKVTDKVQFDPEIKVKRETDTLYISEVRKTKFNYMAVVEVFNSSSKNDKAPLPIGSLSDIAQKAIYKRINSKS